MTADCCRGGLPSGPKFRDVLARRTRDRRLVGATLSLLPDLLLRLLCASDVHHPSDNSTRSPFSLTIGVRYNGRA